MIRPGGAAGGASVIDAQRHKLPESTYVRGIRGERGTFRPPVFARLEQRAYASTRAGMREPAQPSIIEFNPLCRKAVFPAEYRRLP